MRTPAQIARMLGWPAETPLAVGTVTIPAGQPMPAPAERPWPRLRVWTNQYHDWVWDVVAPDGRSIERGGTRQHARSLAVGLAALAAHTAAWVADDPDVVLPR